MGQVDNCRNYHFILWKEEGPIIEYDNMSINAEFLAQDFDYNVCLKFDVPIEKSELAKKNLIGELTRIFYKNRDTFVILTNRKEAPEYQESHDEYIHSFSCNFHKFRHMVNQNYLVELYDVNLIFVLLKFITEGKSGLFHIIVRQIPIETHEVLNVQNADIIIPYKGKISYLRNLMSFVDNSKNINVFVGLDQVVGRQELGFIDNYPNASFYSFTSNPNGPYVIRNWLINQGKADLLFFQDGDDIPCADRFEKISSFMTKKNISLCGSHIIEINYYSKTVQAVRYPLNVKKAMQMAPSHALLHPSSAIQRNEFYACNRLSEERIFANDTKFLYFCYFKLNKIENIDEFLYIKKTHSDSLTTSPATRIGSPVRTQLLNRWVVDFTLIKLGKLELDQSSLIYERPKHKFKVRKL